VYDANLRMGACRELACIAPGIWHGVKRKGGDDTSKGADGAKEEGSSGLVMGEVMEDVVLKEGETS
jgi:hypothetical protein